MAGDVFGFDFNFPQWTGENVEMNFLKRYRTIQIKKAVALARRDFMRSDEKAPPRNRKPHRTARFYAVHFLFHVAIKSPGLLTQDTLSDLMRSYNDCNTHTRLGIIRICQVTKRAESLLFLAYVRGGGFGSDSFLRRSANEAIDSVNETAFIKIGDDYRKWVQLRAHDEPNARPPLMLLETKQETQQEIRRLHRAIRARRH